MKQYLTQIKQGLIFGLTASIVICSSIYLLKATRSSTNPWWDSSPNDLYVSNGETLKATKRNSLVEKINTPKETITCSKSWTCPSTYFNLAYTAADCGWTLPDNNYYVVPQAIQIWWAWQFNAIDFGTASVQIWCPNTSTAYYIKMLYVHK